MTDYDAIVVGAGPAGCMTAKVCAENGLSVLLLEKDAEIGTPKRCAEGLSLNGFEKAGLKPDKKWCAQAINGAVLWSPSGKSVVMERPDTWGYVLERKIFEKHLARDAIKAGADCMVRATVTDLIKEGGKPVGVKADFLGDEVEFTSKLLIGADGTESKVGRMAGIKTTNVLNDYISGFQYEMAGIEGLDESKIHLWFGNEVAPKGYMWAFPKGDGMANVGGGILSTENAKVSVRSYLERFIAGHPEFFKNASPVEVNAGGIPVSGYMKDAFVGDNVMLVGDAAQQVNPIHGGGMSTGLYAGRICGRVAAEAIASGDLSKRKLLEYEEEWRSTDGTRMDKMLKLRHFLEGLSDKDFEYFADVMKGPELEDIQKGKTKFMLKLLVRKPKLLLYARKYLSG